MAQSTKNDLGNFSTFGEAGPRTIAVKLPADLQERILCFPFLQALREKFPEAVLHLISPGYHLEVLNLLPIKAYFHLFELEAETIFEVHRFAVNAKIQNIDLYVSLTNSLLDASLGLFLGARKRVGFSDGWKTLFFNHKTKRPVNHHICEDFFSIYQLLTGQEVPRVAPATSRTLAPLESLGGVPYFAVNLSPLRDKVVDVEWRELERQFHGQRIIFFAADEGKHFSTMVVPFVESFGKENVCECFSSDSWIDLARLLAQAQGVITYSGAFAALAGYVGCRSIILLEGDDPRRTGPLYFGAKIKMLEPEPARLSLPDGQVFLRPRPRFNMAEVGLAAWEFFELS